MSGKLNGKEYIRKLINIAYLCIGIPLLFFIWVYLESTAETLIPIINPKYNTLVLVLIIAISILLILWGYTNYNKRLAEAKEKEDLPDKLLLYQRGNAIRFISYSVSSLLIAIGLFLTNVQIFAALYGIMIVLFSINNPNARKVVNDLKLKDNEKEIILNGLDIS